VPAARAIEVVMVIVAVDDDIDELQVDPTIPDFFE
jgi:hypothetical protein